MYIHGFNFMPPMPSTWDIKTHSNYTCLDSTAAEYSLPKVRSVIDTSSRIIWKSCALSISSRLINKLTCWRCVINCDALNLATTDFNTWQKKEIKPALVTTSITVFTNPLVQSPGQVKLDSVKWKLW